MKQIIDSHIHLDLYKENEIEGIIEQLNNNHIRGLISVSMNLESAKRNMFFSSKYQNVFPAFGYHPEQPLPPNEELTELFNWIELHEHKMIAIGEVGLPYYTRKEQNLSLPVMNEYINLLEQFIILAKRLNKPIILHAVYEDADIACDLLEKYQYSNAHFHWFKGSLPTIKRMISNGYVISVTPDVLYENKIQELVIQYPLEQILVETDGPWPFEGPYEGEQTNPAMIHKSIKKIAELKNLSTEFVYSTIFKNTVQFYNLDMSVHL